MCACTREKKRELGVAAEGLGHSNSVHIQMAKDWNISLDEAKVSTRPARMSSCESW